jgi:hypothetical protein
MKCKRNNVFWDIAFDASGLWVVAARPHVARWAVDDLKADRTGDAGMNNVEWSFKKEYDELVNADALAFDDNGTRLLIAKRYDARPQVAITVYEWPNVVLRQALTFETKNDVEDIFMVLGPQIRIEAKDGSGSREQFTLDLRRTRLRPQAP